jgi:formate hydrogenlyase subunit 3/multisubunit Na+/H+ antiporter MnhD subunit
MSKMKKGLLYIFKNIIGLVFSLSVIGLLFFAIGYFYPGTEHTSEEYTIMFVLVGIVLLLVGPVIKWRKDAFDIFSFLLPF